VLTAADDIDPNAEGIQVNVRVGTANLGPGARVELAVEGGANVASEPIAESGEIHVFQGVTLPRGPAVTKLTCHVVGTSVTGTADNIRVQPECSVRFLHPFANQHLTRADAASGPDGRPAVSVIVQGTGIEPGAGVLLEAGDPGQPARTTLRSSLEGDRAAFDVPIYQGTTRLAATISGGACTAKAEIRVDADLGECVTTLVPASGTNFNAADDLSSTQSDLQTRICLASECVDGSLASIAVDGTAQGTSTAIRGGMACFDVTLTAGSHVVTGRVQGTASNGNAAPATYCVDIVAPTVTISFPTEGATLQPGQDRNPLTVDIMDIVVQGVTGGTITPNCTVQNPSDRIDILVNGSLQDSSSPNANGAFERPIQLVNGPNTVQVCVTDQAGNETCSAEIHVTVALSVPTLHIDFPTTQPLTHAADVDPTTDALDFVAAVSAQNLAAGTAVILDVDDGASSCTGSLQQQGAALSAAIACSLSDGTHKLQARAQDASGNLARSQEVRLLVDNHPPTLSFTSPVEGAQFSAGAVDVVLLTDAEDGQPAALQLDSQTAISAPVSGGGVVFAGVAIPPGAHTLGAAVRDLAGNVSQASIHITRDTTAPAPVFVSPTDGRVFGSADDADPGTPGFQANVVVSVPNEPDGTTVTLLVGDRAPIVRRVAGGALQPFGNINLAEGYNVLIATARDPAGNTGSASVTVRVQTGRPEVAIVSPADGTVLPGSADADPTSDGFQLPVAVAFSAGGTVTSCAVTADGVLWNGVISGSTCTSTVRLTEGPHTLVAVVQSQGQEGRSLPTQVTVDSKAPVLRFVSPAVPSDPLADVVFNASSQDVDGRPGFQTQVVVEADDIESGAIATLTVSPQGGGATTTYTSAFGADRRATFASVTLAAEQRSVLQVTASDRAGNSATPIALTVVVDLLRPTVRITSPSSGQVFGLAGDESPLDGFQKTVSVAVSSLEPGTVMTLTAGNPGTPAGTVGTAAIAAGQTAVTFPAATLPISDGGGVVILTATATDRYGNMARDQIAIHVNLATAQIAWTAPSAIPSPHVYCGSDDLQPATSGLQTVLTFHTTGLTNGLPVVVADESGAEVGRGTVSNGTASVLATLAEGDHVLTAGATDAAGNVIATADTRAVHVDTVGPVVQSITCNGDANGDGFLSRAEDGNPTTTDAFEMNCTVTLGDTSADGQTLRILSTAPQAGTVVGQATVTGNRAVVPVSLVGGSALVAHTLTASTVDACQNASTGTAQYSATVDFTVPGVEVTLPIDGTLLAVNDKVRSTPSILDCCVSNEGVAYDVTALTLGASGTAILRVNGIEIERSTVGADGSVTFPNAPLPQGTLLLTVDVFSPGGNLASSAPVSLLVDSIPPSIQITSPMDSQQFATNTVTVSVSYSNVESGQPIEIRRRPSGSGGVGAFVVAATGVTSGGGATSIPVPLWQGTHELQAHTVDINGNEGLSGVVTVTVTTPASLTWFSPASTPVPFLYCGNADVQPAVPGFQAQLVLRSAGLIDGTTVIVVNGNNQEVVRGTVSGGSASMIATLPEGLSTLTASATDPSGNVIMTVTRSVRVDAVGPPITSFTCDGDNNPADGVLSKIEDQNPATPAFDMTCTVVFADSSVVGGQIQIVSNVPSAGTVVGQATATSTTVPIPVALPATAIPTSVTLSVKAPDVCPNPPEGAYTRILDMVGPAVTITAPLPGHLLAAADKNPATPDILEYDVTATVTGAVGNATLRVTGLAPISIPVGNGSVVFPNVPLPQGNLTLTVEASDAQGILTVSAPVNVLVDSIPPQISISSPMDGASIGTNTFDVTVTYQNVESGQGIQILQRPDSTGTFTPVGNGTTNDTGSTPISIALLQGPHQLKAQTSDINGNPGVSSVISVTVTATGQIVEFVVPSPSNGILNTSSGTVTGSTLHATVVASTSAPAGSNAFLRIGPNAGSLVEIPTPVPVDALGEAQFARDFTDGESGAMQVRVNTMGGDFFSTVLNYTVDITPPTLSFQSPFVAPACPGSVVLTSSTPTFTLASDAINQTVTLSTDAPANPISGTGVVTGAGDGGTATITLNADGGMPDGVQTLTATVSDPAGNPTVVSCSVEVDTIAPAINDFVAQRSLTRRDTIHLSWTMPGDDGLSGTVSSYSILHKTCASTPCTIAGPSDACPVVPDAPPIAVGGTPMAMDVTQMRDKATDPSCNQTPTTIPLGNVHTFQMQATDNANHTTTASSTATIFQSQAVAADLPDGGNSESFYGNSLASGHIINNALSDIVVGRIGYKLTSTTGAVNAGGMLVLYGNGSTPTDIDGTDSRLGLTGCARMGNSVAVADLDGDGYDDVIVGAPGDGIAPTANCPASAACSAAGNTGKAFIFFGGPNGLRFGANKCNAGIVPQDPDCFIQVDTPAGAGVKGFGEAVSRVGDITGGAGRPWIAVGAGDLCISGGGTGQVFLYHVTGSRTQAAGDGGAGHDGDLALLSGRTGADPAIVLAGQADDYHFGISVCGVGDATGDNVPDLVVGATRTGHGSIPGRAYLFYGGSTLSGTVNIFDGGVAPGDGIVPLTNPNTISADAFGTACTGLGSIDGDAKNDIAISSPIPNQVFVFSGDDYDNADAGPPPLRRVTITVPVASDNPGTVAGGFDLDGDGVKDLVIGGKDRVYIYRGTGNATMVSASPAGVFPVTPATGPTPLGLPVVTMSNWKTAVNGEPALPDIAIGRTNVCAPGYTAPCSSILTEY
jgi:hypothetical protein